MTAPFRFNRLIPEFYVSDLGRSLRFYTDVLGFEVEYTRSDPPFALLSYQGSQLMIQETRPDDRHTGALEYPYGRGVNLQIDSDDIDELVRALRAENYLSRKEPAEYWREIAGGALAGTREFQVLDPDGYYLRFAQDLGQRKGSGPTLT
jgi:catechol 2,3-dioxygenase-like lactoylglutathione lyase family enzyme